MFLQEKGFRGRRHLLIKNLHLNSWRMVVEEEGNIVESDIEIDEDKQRDSRDGVLVLVGSCIPVTKEVTMVYHGGWRPT